MHVQYLSHDKMLGDTPTQLLAAEEIEEADREAAAIQSASSPPLSKYEAWQEHWRRQASTHASQVKFLPTGSCKCRKWRCW